MIKSFSFLEFIDDGWATWKLKSLTKAWENVHHRLNEARKHASNYAYGKNISKSPVLWDEEDWKFLSQFPPKFWSKALMWRYNQGIKEASASRDARQDKTLADVKDTGTVVFEDYGRKFVFENIHTGMKSLIEKLEKPIKNHTAHTPPGTQEGDIGIHDIDPFDIDSNSPKHRKNYKYGLYDFDITNPSQLSDEYIDKMPAEDLNLDPNTATPESIKAAKDALKARKNKLLSFSGFSGISQEQRASTYMGNWIKAQGLGLLGKVPDKITDPITGQEVSVEQDVSPSVLAKGESVTKKGGKGWPDHVGVDQHIPLKVPAIKRNISYKVISKDGTIKPVSETIRIPVLSPGKLLPRITNLSQEQRDKLAIRRGEEKGEDEEGKQSGGIRDLASLLSNYDILTPDQIEHLKTNQRDMYHYVTAQQNLHDDKWSQSKENYKVGFSPSHNKKGTVPIGMGEEDFKKVLDKYLPLLTQRADKKIGDFLRTAGSDRSTVNDEDEIVDANTRKDKKYPPEIIKMLESIHTDLAQVCGALLALNLQSPKYGIYDPEVKLTHAAKDAESYDPKLAQHERDAFTYNFARNLTQAAFGDVPSRRQRQRQGVGAVSLDAAHGQGDTQTTLGAGISGNQADRGAGSDWDSRRVELNPKRGSEYDPVTGQMVYNIARLGWNIPKMGQEIDKFFAKQTDAAGGEGNSFVGSIVERAKKRMKAVVETTRELYEKYAQEAMTQGVPQDQIEAKAQEEVEKNLKSELESKHPQLFQGVTDQQIKRIIGDQKSQLSGTVLTPELKQELNNAWESYFKAIISGQKGYVPAITYDDEDKMYMVGSEYDPSGRPLSSTLGNFSTYNAKDIVDILKTQGEHFAQKYAVAFVRAIAEKNNRPMRLEDAISAVRTAGIEPSIDANDAIKHTPATPPPQIQPTPVTPSQSTPAQSTPAQQSIPTQQPTPASKLTAYPTKEKANDLNFVRQHKSEIEAFMAQANARLVKSFAEKTHENNPQFKSDLHFKMNFGRALKKLEDMGG